ncbi:MAG TPA: hypothetical protein VFH88_07600 [Candidatus Krumholzibacteria bacterium]|nr:hypothetical protein [Candidatus Krumholzibacteria bacterium]
MRTAPAHARPRATPSPDRALTVALSAAVILFVFICYWPLTRYFFAQDDFIFLERAGHGLHDALAPFFNGRPGQFRPLTKGLYFVLAWPVFGFHPLPYHVVSIALHGLNSILVGVLLRRLGISRAVSWMAALWFAANMCHMEAVAWISCVQQLIGAAFVLTALIFGMDALAAGSRRTQVIATLAYALALCSYEQTLAVPLVLLTWQWIQGGARSALRAASGPLRWMLLLLAAYLGYVATRGMPDSGPYVMSVGKNVIDNLRQYASVVFSLWLVYPEYGLPQGITPSHWAWGAVLVMHALLQTWRALIFGCAAFMWFLGPVLFNSHHTHSFHLYVPAIGAWFLLASIADSVWKRVRASRPALVALAGMTIVIMVGSVIALQKNVNTQLDMVPLPRSFVLRRAVLAERMCTAIESRWSGSGAERLVLVYPGTRGANWRNVQSALGSGSALRLLLRKPDLDVVFVPPDPMPGANAGEVLVYTELGQCFGLQEWRNLRRNNPEWLKNLPEPDGH